MGSVEGVLKKGNTMQKKSTLLTTTLLALAFLFVAVAGAADHQYIGATKCKTCHNSTKKGKIYDKWLSTAHSKAYTNLASEEALKVAKEKGIEDPQKSADCLGCHVTGYAAKAELKGEKYSVEEGVTCEACHGPGGDYFKMSTMKGLVSGESGFLYFQLAIDLFNCLVIVDIMIVFFNLNSISKFG